LPNLVTEVLKYSSFYICINIGSVIRTFEKQPLVLSGVPENILLLLTTD